MRPAAARIQNVQTTIGIEVLLISLNPMEKERERELQRGNRPNLEGNGTDVGTGRRKRLEQVKTT